MRVIIVGGGKVGNYIVKELSKSNYSICIIEKNSATCQKLAEEVDVEIIHGDGTDLSVLKDADIENADIVAAITGKDEVNFIICQIAKKEFNIKKTIARISNPKNSKIFKMLSVDRVICSTEIIADIIEWELESKNINFLNSFDDKGTILTEATIGLSNPWIGKSLTDLELTADSRVIAVIKEQNVVYPEAVNTLDYGDKLLIMCNASDKKLIENTIFRGKRYER